jgi:hypothetical protein
VTKADAQVEMWEERIAEKLLDSSGGGDQLLMKDRKDGRDQE